MAKLLLSVQSPVLIEEIHVLLSDLCLNPIEEDERFLLSESNVGPIEDVPVLLSVLVLNGKNVY